MSLSFDNEGLPILPDGYFWRVTEVSMGFWEVQLRKRMLIGSRTVEKSVHDSWQPITRSSVQEGALYAYTNWVDPTYYDRLEEQVWGKTDPKLIGDH